MFDSIKAIRRIYLLQNLKTIKYINMHCAFIPYKQGLLLYKLPKIPTLNQLVTLVAN